MKLIAEYTNEGLGYSITEGKNGKKETYIEGIFMQAEGKNRNGRVYTREVLTAAVDRYNNEQVMTGKVSHRITELKWDGNNVIGKALVLDTPMGQIVKGLVEGGVQLGVSSRGMGSLENRNGVSYVKDDFMLSTVDIVQDPSAPNAFVNGIMEGVDWKMDGTGHYIQTIEEGETEMMETVTEEVVDNTASEVTGFEHFLSKL